MNTFTVKKEEIQKKWYLIDAQGKVLGRLATRIAEILMGKDKPVYSPHIDVGDHVIVINADKVTVTGKKEREKVYYQHSQYPGGLKTQTYRELKQNNPERIIAHAVKGMLPNNKLRDLRMKKLKIYRGNKHDHQAQKPEKLEI